MHEKENRVSAAYGGTAYWTCGIQLQRPICAEAGNQTFYCFFQRYGQTTGNAERYKGNHC